MIPCKARANEVERTPTANDTFWFRSPALEREKPDMERKYVSSDMAQRKEPELTNLISEVGGGTNIQSKQAHLQYKS